MPCKVVLAAEVASSYTSEIKSEVSQKSARPKLVGFLANDDPYAEKYAQSSSKHLAEAGLDFELRQIPREELEAALVEANGDPLVSGILVYYPVYGDSRDQKLQDMVDPTKDVEGLNVVYNGKLYSNDRYLDDEKTRKAILPCTPLAVVKVLDHIGVYDHTLPYGDHLRGKTIAVVNRSEVVGRPLAALLANDGAKRSQTTPAADVYGMSDSMALLSSILHPRYEFRSNTMASKDLHSARRTSIR
ncbi:Methylenetetrahydrofolate dehydrogenase [NAD(+)] [Coemansia thaxteri]|nr:Methylenetetrahydrofolate dehydrogenase [NAD(+)] [Coemansia thaxteri]